PGGRPERGCLWQSQPQRKLGEDNVHSGRRLDQGGPRRAAEPGRVRGGRTAGKRSDQSLCMGLRRGSFRAREPKCVDAAEAGARAERSECADVGEKAEVEQLANSSWHLAQSGFLGMTIHWIWFC